jgi:putative endonuclease
MYYVYIVTNKHHSVLYIGVTSNLEGRIWEHREKLIEGFTKRYQAGKLIFVEDYPDPLSAIAREKQLKGWRREKKVALIEKANPRWNDLFEQITAGFDMDILKKEKREPLIVRDPSTSSG